MGKVNQYGPVEQDVRGKHMPVKREAHVSE